MNLNELIEALTELKNSGKAVDKLPVFFKTRRCNLHKLNKIRVITDNSGILNGIFIYK